MVRYSGETISRELMFERKFHVQGLQERILLHIFVPRPEHDAWICEYQLKVPGWEQPICVPIAGIDKLQSVTAVFRRVRSDLALIAERLGRQITFLDEPRLDLI